VLVVEPAPYAARLLREMNSGGNLGVEGAREPADALRRLRGEPFDVVVIDLSGQWEAAESFFDDVAELDPRLAGRVVFLAGDLSEPEARRFLTRAGRPFLTHPVDPGQLHELVVRVGLEARLDSA
jgi:DNA-binding NtrC family response regulator